MLSEKIKKKRFHEVIQISVISSLISAFFTGMSNMAMKQSFVISAMIGGLIGFMVPFLYIQGILYLQRIIRGRKVRYINYVLAHFLMLFGIAALVYTVLGEIFYREYIISNAGYAFILTFVLAAIFVAVDIIKQFLGKDFIANIFLGKYHIPKEENMIVCFVDIKDSTKWAETLGGARFFDMINDFLQTVEQCADYYHGEIYKFLGDGIIIVWHSRSKEYENALSFIKELKEEVENKQKYYAKVYGDKLKFTLGMHEGNLIVGELGLERKEIGYWGDTINTASRIASECKKQEALILISEHLFQHFQQSCPHLLTELKASVIQDILLRGKTNPMNLVKLYER